MQSIAAVAVAIAVVIMVMSAGVICCTIFRVSVTVGTPVDPAPIRNKMIRLPGITASITTRFGVMFKYAASANSQACLNVTIAELSDGISKSIIIS